MNHSNPLSVCFFLSHRYTVMSGTPEKILEHMLETIKLETNGSDFIGMTDL